jgi:predicted ATP-dependent serine protease
VTQWTLVAASDALQLERSDGFKALARRMLQSPEWQKVVGQPVDPQQTLLIQAAPGSGKSTLLREWCRGRPNNKILLLAFNKAVAKQLPGVVEAMFISIGKCTTWGTFREQ